MDGKPEIVLDNKKLLSENSEDLIPFLQSIEKAYGVPLAVVIFSRRSVKTFSEMKMISSENGCANIPYGSY